jgi:hypothetical protein
VCTASDVLDLPLVASLTRNRAGRGPRGRRKIPPGSAKPFEAGGDIDAVAIDVAAILDDASRLILCGTNALLLRDGRVVHCHLALERRSTPRGRRWRTRRTNPPSAVIDDPPGERGVATVIPEADRG